MQQYGSYDRPRPSNTPNMNGNGNTNPNYHNSYRPASGGSSMYSGAVPNPPLQIAVQDPDLQPSNARYGTNGSTHQTPPSEALLNGYSAMANGGGDRNGIGHRPVTPRHSGMLDVNDPVAVHLLVETALGDSHSYHVLSFDEVESLKQELAALTPRIEGVRVKLALECKVRDAALSLNRLYSTGTASNRRNSGMRSNRDSISKTEEELGTSNKKCADLSKELYSMENRQREVQTRLLMHTAGVLQMTHKGPTAKRTLDEFRNVPDGMVNGLNVGRRPDSPTSIYTYENERFERALARGGRDEFDERSLYRTADELYGFASESQGPYGEQRFGGQDFSDLGKRLEDLNTKLRDAIAQAGGPGDISPLDATHDSTNPKGMESVTAQLENVGRNFEMLSNAQGGLLQQNHDLQYSVQEKGRQLNEALERKEAEYEQMLNERNVEIEKLREASERMERRLDEEESRSSGLLGPDAIRQIQHFNKQLYGLLNASAAAGFKRQETPPPPSFDRQDPEAEIAYMEKAVSSFSTVHQQMLSFADDARENEDRASSDRDRAEQMATVLTGLWSIILTSDPDDSTLDVNQQFSLPAFNNRVQRLVGYTGDLKDRLSQAESDSSATKTRHDARERDLLSQLDLAKVEVQKIPDLQRQLALHKDEATTLQSALEAARTTTAERQDALQALRKQLSEKDVELTQAKKDAEAASTAAASSPDKAEVERLETELVRLTTELTLAKAELDAAYGSRAERKAEANGETARQLEAVKAELASLQASQTSGPSPREKELETELKATLADFEELTKASVDSEKERDKLEGVVDGLRERVEEVEGQLSEERLKWLGVKGPGEEGGSEAMSVTTMRAEFKRMMRETRLEGVKALRTEQEERKKLEAQVRQLRKEQSGGAAKSGLSKMFSLG